MPATPATPPANLFEAIDTGDWQAIAPLVAKGADVDEIDLHQYQATPLAHACTRGDEAAVRALLLAGAMPDFAAFAPPVVAAATHGFADVVALLVAAGADLDNTDESGATALWVAAAQGFSAIARSLVEAGADRARPDSEGVTPAAVARDNGHAALADYLDAPGVVDASAALWSEGATLADVAAQAQRAALSAPPATADEVPRWTIKGGCITQHLDGARIVQDLAGVASAGSEELVAALLDSGLSPDWTAFRGHANALMTAARAGELGVVNLLLARGANPRVADFKGQTAVHFALFKPSARRHGPVLAALLAAGADPNAADESGQRPLHMALRHGLPGLVEALLAAGGNAWLRDSAGRCPADWAPTEGKNAAAIAKLLAATE